jgi:hypothetical protein
MKHHFTKAAAFLLILTLYSGCAKYKPNEPRTISVRDVYISGDWKEFIAVENGDYVMEDDDGRPRIGIKLTLLKTYAGEADNPANTFELNALSANGTNMGKRFWVDNKNKFNDFVRGQKGDTTSITFIGYKMDNTDNWFTKIEGFEAESQKPSSKQKDTAKDTGAAAKDSGTAAKEPDPAAVVTRDTRTDPVFDNRTIARTGPRIVAVPELTATQAIPNDLVVSATSYITGYLIDNKDIHSVVDYSRIAEAQKQLQFEAGDWSNPAKYAEIGRALNVDTIAVGTIAEGGKALGFVKTYDISVQLIDIATFSVVGAFTVAATQRDYLASETQKAIKKMKVKL